MSILKRIRDQINPFDHGATFSHPAAPAPLPRGILAHVNPLMVASPPAPGARGTQLRVNESYMNINPHMNPHAVSSGIAASYLNVRPGMARPGTIQPIMSNLQAGYTHPRLQQGNAGSSIQIQDPAYVTQAQPSYLNIQG